MKTSANTKMKNRNYTVSVLLGAMIFCMCQNLTGAVLPDLMSDYQMNLDYGGLMSTFQFIGSIIGVLVVSRIADRTKKPLLLVIGFALSSLMMLLIGGFPPFALFMTLYLILGAALGIVDMDNNAVISDLHQESRNTVLSLLHGVCGLGASFIPILTAIIGTGNWSSTYRIVAAVLAGIVVFQLCMYLSRKKEIDSTAPKAEKKDSKGVRRLFWKDRRIWTAALSMLFFGVCQSGTTVWSVTFCRTNFPEAGAFGWAFSLSAYWLGTMICRLLGGTLKAVQKLDSRLVIIWGGIAAAAAELLGILSGQYIGVIAGIFAMGFLNGLTIPRIVGLMNGWYPVLSGLATSVSFVALYLGWAVTPLVMGVAAASAGMVIMMFIPTAGALLSGVLGFGLPKAGRSRRSP